MADLTFLMSADPAGSPNPFYALAEQYFTAAGSTVVAAPPEGQTLEGVLEELATRGAAQTTINIVSRAAGPGAIDGAVTRAMQAAGRTSTTAGDLRDALAAKALTPPGPDVVTDGTRIVLYGGDAGRSLTLLKLLSGLFASPGELLAPRRLSVFAPDGAAVAYRQARSWSLVRKAPLVPAGGSEPDGGWPAYRDRFVTDASEKFGPAALASEPGGDARLQEILTAAASGATTAPGPAFFLEETIEIAATGSQTAAEAAASIAPLANGDPVVAAAQSAADVDDATVVTTVGGADAYPADTAGTTYAITLVVLAQVIDGDVVIAEGPGYARLTASAGLAPSPGPGGGTGTGTGGGGTGEISAELQAAIDDLLAGGAAQADVDALVAAIPRGDAAEAAETDVAADDDGWAGEGPDYLDPDQVEMA